MASIGDTGIWSGDVLLSSRGIWTATVVPFDDSALSEGQAVTITVGTLSLVGTILRGSVLPEGAGFFVLGGAGKWRKGVARKSYQDDKGVKLADVLRDLVSEAGERHTLAAALGSTVLGRHWVRPEGSGVASLNALGQPWRVRPDGVTEVGPMVYTASEGLFSVRSYAAASRTALLEVPDEDVAELVPGKTLDMGGTSLQVDVTRIILGGGTVRVEVTGL